MHVRCDDNVIVFVSEDFVNGEELRHWPIPEIWVDEVEVVMIGHMHRALKNNVSARRSLNKHNGLCHCQKWQKR